MIQAGEKALEWRIRALRWKPATLLIVAIRFLFAGVVNTVVGLVVYATLLYLELDYVNALLATVTAAFVFNLASYAVAFRSSLSLGVTARFLAVFAILFVFNLILLRVFLSQGYGPMLGQVFAAPFVAVLSFLLLDSFVFRRFSFRGFDE